MIKFPGRQPTAAERPLLRGLITLRSQAEVIIIHHISKDMAYALQLEIERRCPINGIKFERVIFNTHFNNQGEYFKTRFSIKEKRWLWEDQEMITRAEYCYMNKIPVNI